MISEKEEKSIVAFSKTIKSEKYKKIEKINFIIKFIQMIILAGLVFYFRTKLFIVYFLFGLVLLNFLIAVKNNRRQKVLYSLINKLTEEK